MVFHKRESGRPGLKSVIGAVGLVVGVLAPVAAQASPINVGGVVFDPDNPISFQMNSGNLRESQVTMPGDVLHGYGLLSTINGTSQATYCPSGCEVTFEFTYTVASITANKVSFTNGSAQFYVDSTPDFNVLDPNSASNDGVLWLDLAGHTTLDFDMVTTGDLIGTLSGGSFGGVLVGNGVGAFDVVGGLAQANFDTDTLDDMLGGTTDFTFTSSFQSTVNEPTSHPIFGSFDMQGDAIPEPATLGLFGLGLIGLGLATRRRKSRQ